MKTNFNINAWNNKTNNFESCIFECEVIKCKSLVKYSNTNYWYDGREGKDWFRGGYWKDDFGFMNANVELSLNVEGVVFEGVVYKLINIKTN